MTGNWPTTAVAIRFASAASGQTGTCLPVPPWFGIEPCPWTCAVEITPLPWSHDEPMATVTTSIEPPVVQVPLHAKINPFTPLGNTLQRLLKPRALPANWQLAALDSAGPKLQRKAAAKPGSRRAGTLVNRGGVAGAPFGHG